jgi:predicted N-acetyltransferase YhbS
MKIRLLKKEDIKAAAKTICQNYSKKYEARAVLELKEMFGRSPIKPIFFVAEDEGVIVGFAGFIQSWMDYNIYQIPWVSVTPARQGQGIGKQLVARVISEIKKKSGARLILLTADKSKRLPEYYRKYFKFKVLQSFNEKREYVMVRSLEK